MLVLNYVRPVKIHEGLMGLNPKYHCSEGCVTARNLFLPCKMETKNYFYGGTLSAKVTQNTAMSNNVHSVNDFLY